MNNFFRLPIDNRGTLYSLQLIPYLSACNCNEAGTTSQICASVSQGDVAAGTCICKANVALTMKCDTCKPDHYNIDARNPLGCTGNDLD